MEKMRLLVIAPMFGKNGLKNRKIKNDDESKVFIIIFYVKSNIKVWIELNLKRNIVSCNNDNLKIVILNI